MRGIRTGLFAIASVSLAAACGAPRTVHSTPAAAQPDPSSVAGASSASSIALTSPSSTASAAPLASATPLPPPPADRVFVTGPAISFTQGATPKQRLIAKQQELIGASAAGDVIVLGYDQKGTLITPSKPKGIPFPANSMRDATFSPDGTKIAIRQFLSSLIVISATDATVLYERDVGESRYECAVRWTSNDTLVFHEESQRDDARLWHLDLRTKQAVASGDKRRVDQCVASPDGARWIVTDEYDKQHKGGAARVIDGATGAATLLAADLGESYALSPRAERICISVDKSREVECIRTDDRGVERVVAIELGSFAGGMQFEETGRRAMILGYVEKGGDDGSDPVTLLADFVDGTVRVLKGPQIKSGGGLDLLPGGHLMTSGSAGGIEVFDLDAGKRSFAAHNEMYEVKPISGAPRTFVGAEDNLGDLYLITVP